MHVTFQYVAPLRHSFWLPRLAILIAAGRVLVQHVLRLYCIRLNLVSYMVHFNSIAAGRI